jgi:predicted AlkP superfamily pyrophosphatase or phosphodiesterase
MSDILVQLAKAAIDGEQLGKDEVPDTLFVSFSAVDRIYHLFGPYSWETQDAMVRLDRSIGELLAAADKAAGGRANLLVVLTADHGGAAIPEEWAAAGLPAARISASSLQQGLAKELQSKFNAPDLVAAMEEVSVYLNPKSIADHKLDAAAVRRAAAQWLARQPSIALAVPKDDLFTRDSSNGLLSALQRGYYPERSGDVLFVVKPFQVLTDEPSGTSHGTPYAYDTEVPLIFAGKGVRPGLYRQIVDPIDLAPTVASVLEIGSPASSEGTIRAEALSFAK